MCVMAGNVLLQVFVYLVLRKAYPRDCRTIACSIVVPVEVGDPMPNTTAMVSLINR